MKRLQLTIAAVAAILCTGSTTSANDLVKALQGYRGAGLQTSFRGGYHSQLSSRDRLALRSAQAREDARLRRLAALRPQPGCSQRGAVGLPWSRQAAALRAAEARREAALARQRAARRRAGVRVGFGIGIDDVPPLRIPAQRPIVAPRHRVPVRVPVRPAPRIRPDYRFGDIVRHDVCLYKRVRVSDRHDIAPHAVPTIVAVKDPAACAHACSCCGDELVYVQVMAPRCQPRRVTISPCGRRICLDYGRYEVRVAAGSRSIKIDYDD